MLIRKPEGQKVKAIERICDDIVDEEIGCIQKKDDQIREILGNKRRDEETKRHFYENRDGAAFSSVRM